MNLNPLPVLIGFIFLIQYYALKKFVDLQYTLTSSRIHIVFLFMKTLKFLTIFQQNYNLFSIYFC